MLRAVGQGIGDARPRAQQAHAHDGTEGDGRGHASDERVRVLERKRRDIGGGGQQNTRTG